MRAFELPASYLCAAVAGGLLALHFDAERLPAWTAGLSLFAGVVALTGTLFAALYLAGRGWTSLRNWSGQVALALNAFFALGFLI